MKRNVSIHLIICCMLVSAQIASASCWKAKIMGEREESKPKVLIGEGVESQTYPYPPDPPADKCLIQLLSSDKTKRLTTDIRQTGSQETIEWLLLVNPHGEGPLGNTTCTLSWSLDKGFSLTDFNDNILIADMSQTTTYPVSSMSDDYLRFKIKYQKTPFGLSALIRNLQILSGVLISTWEDLNCDKKIDLADVISLMQQVSE
ncbi:MAG: hypothetical protein OMM_04447 [Candidatus Magnetoglobus multicellularis str. Araruama]|uniref:EF-hand domain-containing protein n=1 Tax=Candidatus Magnetoglobus multicellularis str. Araruama TaxID=890399 RepID=A0A1V1P197_9BACT|nr:MAG: hypothetical protein OMM_04447 [Candidatus Magnetoglobus multicellularis str. Araruama]